MRKHLETTCLTALASTSLFFGALSPARGGLPEGMSAEASVTFASKYVWRGQLLNDDPVVQPSLTLGYKGLSLNVWGSIDTTDYAGDGEAGNIQEVDYTLSYGFSPMEGLDLEAGWILYDFPGADDTKEVYISATASSLPLSPSLSVYYDYDEVKGFYVSAGISQAIPVRVEKLSVEISAAVGWGDRDYNAAYFGINDSGFSDISLTASIGYAVTEHVSVGAFITFTEILDSNLENAANAVYGDSDNIITGINVSLAF